MIRGLGRRLNFPRGVAFGRPVASIALLVAAGTALAQSCDTFAGMDAYNRGDVATAYRLLAEQARTGDPEAEVNLGYLYARGQGVEVNQITAFHLYSLSAAQGDREGRNALGYKHQLGSGDGGSSDCGS